jgi:hypothetical protein
MLMTYWNFLIKFHLSNNTNKKGYILNFNVLTPDLRGALSFIEK